MRVVADASVVVRWFLPAERSDEEGETAAALLAAVKKGSISLLQPPHWLAEVAAVLTRLSPSTARDDITLLGALDYCRCNAWRVQRARRVPVYSRLRGELINPQRDPLCHIARCVMCVSAGKGTGRAA